MWQISPWVPVKFKQGVFVLVRASIGVGASLGVE
jgi:hypothetical protein